MKIARYDIFGLGQMNKGAGGAYVLHKDYEKALAGETSDVRRKLDKAIGAIGSLREQVRHDESCRCHIDGPDTCDCGLDIAWRESADALYEIGKAEPREEGRCLVSESKFTPELWVSACGVEWTGKPNEQIRCPCGGRIKHPARGSYDTVQEMQESLDCPEMAPQGSEPTLTEREGPAWDRIKTDLYGMIDTYETLHWLCDELGALKSQMLGPDTIHRHESQIAAFQGELAAKADKEHGHPEIFLEAVEHHVHLTNQNGTTTIGGAFPKGYESKEAGDGR